LTASPEARGRFVWKIDYYDLGILDDDRADEAVNDAAFLRQQQASDEADRVGKEFNVLALTLGSMGADSPAAPARQRSCSNSAWATPPIWSYATCCGVRGAVMAKLSRKSGEPAGPTDEACKGLTRPLAGC
jgi:hypothetical protein